MTSIKSTLCVTTLVFCISIAGSFYFQTNATGNRDQPSPSECYSRIGNTRSETPAKISGSQATQPSDKKTRTQTEQPPAVSTQDDLKKRYTFFRGAIKSSILNTYGVSDSVFMLGKESKPYCEELLPDIVNDENIDLVEPLLTFENIDSPALVNYRSCDSKSALHSKYGDFDRINSGATAFSTIGTQAFRFYGDMRLGENTIAKDVIYSESEPYFAGYLALDSQSCEFFILATNNPTTFPIPGSHSWLFDTFLIKWRDKYIHLEGYGYPPFEVRADSLAVREESHIIECDWVAHSKETAESNPWGGKPVLRSIIKDKTKTPGSDKGSERNNQN